MTPRLAPAPAPEHALAAASIPGRGHVVVVVGGSGGLGASVLASALATRAARRERSASTLGQDRRAAVCLVDMHDGERTLTVLHGVEDEPGLTWRELRDADGPIAPAALLRRLPRDRDGVVLLADPPALSMSVDTAHPLAVNATAAPLVAHPCAQPVINALSRGSDLVILDAQAVPAGVTIDQAIILSGTGLTSIVGSCAAAEEALNHLPAGRVHLVLRDTGRRARPSLLRSLAEEMGVLPAGILPTDPAIERTVWAGLPPGARTGPLTAFVDALFARLTLGGHGGVFGESAVPESGPERSAVAA